MLELGRLEQGGKLEAISTVFHGSAIYQLVL